MSGSVVGATNSRTISDKLNYLLDKGHAKDDYIQWGLGKRNVIIIGAKSTNIRRVKYLVYYKIKLCMLYIVVSLNL